MNVDDFNLEYEYDDCFSEEKIRLKNNLDKIDKKINSRENKYNDNNDEISSLSGYGEDLKYKQELLFENKNLLNQINIDKELKKQPYFGRMKLVSDDEVMDIYIGEKSIDDITNNPIVYDWRAPVTSLFYANQLTYKYKDYNYKVNLKRKILVENSILLHCEDSYSKNKKHNEITDEFLKKVLLEKKSNDKFVDIIKTIQEKQNDIIRENITKNVIVEGIAGSGKTVIILHRISFLLFNNPEISESSFLFIAPNNIFKDKLSELNKKLQIDKINIRTIQEYYLSKLNYFFIKGDNKNNLSEFLEIENDNYETGKYFCEKYSSEYFENILSFFNKIYSSKLLKLIEILEYVPNNKETLYSSVKNTRGIVKNKLDEMNLIENKIKSIFHSDKLYGNEASKADLIFKYLSCNKNEISLINYDSPDDLIKNIQEKFILKFGKTIYEKIHNYSLDFRIINNDIKNKEYKLCNFLDENSIYKKNFVEENIRGNLFKKIRNDYEKKLKKIEEVSDEIEYLNKIIKKSENKLYKFFNNKKIIKAHKEIDKKHQMISSLMETKNVYDDAIKISSDIVKLIKKKDKINKEISELDESMKSAQILLDLLYSYNNFINNYKKSGIYLSLNNNDIDIGIINIYKYIYSAVDKNIDNKIVDVSDFLIEVTKYINDIDFSKKENLNIYIDELDELLNPIFVFNNYEKYIQENDQRAINKFYNKKKRTINRADSYILLKLISEIGFNQYSNYIYVYIDEAQDYNDNEIKLINDLESNPVLNIYGDVGQKIINNVHERKDFSELDKILKRKFVKYNLIENYRNTIDVVEYCNKNLKKNIIAIGNKGNKIVERKFKSIEELINDINGLDFVIITNVDEFIDKLNLSGIKCFTVIQSKGLEFKNVVVIDIDLDNNSRYVAYTRTLNDLIIYK
ncbi:MAG: hypothetical protein PHN42_04645 [Bacilli bacterium]|nr:hypothetical protein [Bacilli bacterium]